MVFHEKKKQLVQLSTKTSAQVGYLEITTLLRYVCFPFCHKIPKQGENQGLGFNEINIFYTISRTLLLETGFPSLFKQ